MGVKVRYEDQDWGAVWDLQFHKLLLRASEQSFDSGCSRERP